jgi:hypothetical protein
MDVNLIKAAAVPIEPLDVRKRRRRTTETASVETVLENEFAVYDPTLLTSVVPDYLLPLVRNHLNAARVSH